MLIADCDVRQGNIRRCDLYARARRLALDARSLAMIPADGLASPSRQARGSVFLSQRPARHSHCGGCPSMTEFHSPRGQPPAGVQRQVPAGIDADRTGRGGQRVWIIREVDTAALPGARANRCLICECAEGLVRRVWHYPADWHELSEERLRSLCED